MKAAIHPDYHDITYVMSDGSKFQTRSTMGKAGDVIQLDVDRKTHPAWIGGTGTLKKTGRMERFSNQFGDLSFGAKKDA